MIKRFQDFILKGNVMTLAVGLMMGAAFTSVVTALSQNILTPLLDIPLKSIQLKDLAVQIGGAEIKYGLFLQSIVQFLITAICLFLIVQVLEGAQKAFVKKKVEEKKEEKPKKETPTQAELYLKEIRDLLKEGK